MWLAHFQFARVNKCYSGSNRTFWFHTLFYSKCRVYLCCKHCIVSKRFLILYSTLCDEDHYSIHFYLDSMLLLFCHVRFQHIPLSSTEPFDIYFHLFYGNIAHVGRYLSQNHSSTCKIYISGKTWIFFFAEYTLNCYHVRWTFWLVWESYFLHPIRLKCQATNIRKHFPRSAVYGRRNHIVLHLLLEIC